MIIMRNIILNQTFMILAIEIEYLLVTAEYRCNKLNLGIRYTI